MKCFTTLKEVHNYQLDSSSLGAVLRVLRGEQEFADPAPYDPERQGRIWLLEATDTDETVSDVLGKPLTELSFDGVIHDEGDGCFLCLHAVASSVCHTLIVPDKSWLSPKWREHLTSQQ